MGRFHATSPEVPAPAKRSRPARSRARSRALLVPGLAALLTATAAGCAAVDPAGSAAEPGGGAAGAAPAPLVISTASVPNIHSAASGASAKSHQPATFGDGTASFAQHAGSLVLDDTGSEMTAWNQTTSYCPSTSGFYGNGSVSSDSSGDALLTTPSSAGSCVALISPQAYSSGVIEADIDMPALPGHPGTIANWGGFWLTNGPDWPDDGELDAVEVEPVNGQAAVTWHSGTSADLFSASTSGLVGNQLPMERDNLGPGWHVVDIVYTRGYFAVYYDGQQYTSYTSSNIPGAPLNIYFTMSNTPNISSIDDLIGGPPINSSSEPATYKVKYLKVWSYK